MKFSLGVCRPFGPFVYFQSSTTRTYEGSGGFRFKVNFRNVFVGPRRKSLPTARFCNPRTLICWQDGLKSVDPPVPPRDPLYFLRLSGKNPRNDAGRIHHRSNFRLHSASPLPSFPRGGPSRIAFPKYIYLATCSTKGKKRSSIIADHVLVSFLHFCALSLLSSSVLAGSTRPVEYIVTVLLIRSIAAWKP